MRIGADHLPAQGRARQLFHLDLAPCRGERHQRGRPQNLGIVAIAHDQTASIRPERFRLHAGAIERGVQPPEEPVAMLQVISPLAIAHEVRPADLDLHDDHVALGIDPHQVGPPPATQGHFGKAPDPVPGEQPPDSPRDGGRMAALGLSHGRAGRIGHWRAEGHDA